MEKANLKKQTTLLLFLLSLFLSSSSLLAQTGGPEEQCNELIDQILIEYEETVDPVTSPLCGFVDEVNMNVSSDCPTPENVTTSVSGNSIEVGWDLVSGITKYEVRYLNINTGQTGTITTDQPPVTFNNLDPGIYVFAIRRICADSLFSLPAYGVDRIIGDIIAVRGEVDDEHQEMACNCPSETVIHQPANYTGPDTLGWHSFSNINCEEKYMVYLKMINTPAAEIAIIKRPNGIGFAYCAANNIDLELNTNDNSILVKESANSDPLFSIKFKSSGIVFEPTSTYYSTKDAAGSYNLKITLCCQLTTKPGTGTGDDKEKKENKGKKYRGGSNGNPGINAPLLSAPNPFLNETTIYYTLPDDSNLSLNLYNALGQQLRQIKVGFHPAGTYQTPLRSESLQPGLYYLRLKTKTQDELIKLIKL